MTRHTMAAILVLTSFLSGCNGTTVEVEVTVTEIQKETTEWGCVGTNLRTIIKDKQHRVASLCGKWGEVGDVLLVKRTTGHWDPAVNGVRLN